MKEHRLTKRIASALVLVAVLALGFFALAPGFIETDMTEDLPADFKAHVEKNAPAGRLGKPEDIAPAILFLASQEAGYITGQTLTVDGGLFL